MLGFSTFPKLFREETCIQKEPLSFQHVSSPEGRFSHGGFLDMILSRHSLSKDSPTRVAQKWIRNV